ncbi:hypothetical protein BCV72DRAFT_234480 [Rhizopus microsporus var. microsporus]|uniref:Uncharacterized protein n=2 Tax=Rhizopus microsporus TaxID=58291 RepID=A0A2G4SJZ2_RHIZD|nr:uncharacterized protein RHIMIDRAFT_263922 [Rhizopus microsporus ATCC 52813]ORE02602.1 hypothetical protein BCV72DRAFT_234480 [Rhizopus microsporus var. microsporus]PHZ09098.1 hypothetical protein RHIMIDRAFT_263922 [Rhizopus microsporus ATCC 52813]
MSEMSALWVLSRPVLGRGLSASAGCCLCQLLVYILVQYYQRAYALWLDVLFSLTGIICSSRKSTSVLLVVTVE